MKRTVLIKIGDEARSVSPAVSQWAGMQYEDNATEVVFDLSALEIQNALYRIDFNSVTAGYFPSENLTPDDMPSVRRSIPKYLTQYGGELEAVAVITPLNGRDEPAGEVLSYPVTLYFTEVSRGNEGEAEFIPSLSALENEVRRAVCEADELVLSVEQKLQNGDFQGEKGDKGDKGEPGRDAVIDQSYSSDSLNAQSGRAVAEAISHKANLQLKPIEVEELAYLSGLKEGSHIYELSQIIPNGINDCLLCFTDGTQLIASVNESFRVGKKYLISTTLDPESGYIFDVVAEAVDLEDKLGLDELPDAISSLDVGWKKLADITTTEEVNSITATTEEFPLLMKCKNFLIRVIYQKVEGHTNLQLGSSRILCNDTLCYQANATNVSYAAIGEQRIFLQIIDGLVHSVGTEGIVGQTALMGGVKILVGSRFVTEAVSEIKYLLSNQASMIPIGTKLEIYGRVEI